VKVSAVMAARDEPVARVQRAVDALAAQVAADELDIEVLIAAPPAQHAALSSIGPSGAVRRVRLVRNPSGERSAGLNRAVREASAPYVVRVDARSVVPPNYVGKCVARLRAVPAVGVVGGVQRPSARDDSPRARGIARALRNPWVLGGAKYRRAGSAGSADTVYLGTFRRDELLTTPFDEGLLANEDFDLCTRFRDAGRDVWIEAGLEVEYEARNSYRDLWRQYASFGASKVDYWRRRRKGPNARQVVALFGAGTAALALATQVRRPLRAAALATAGVVALALTDHVADPEEHDLRVRAHALAASATVVTAWLGGLTHELASKGGV
jgi:GT2 family glycosyltransferase